MIASLLLLAAVSGQVPEARCVSAYGETKCGYACVAAYGEIKCAATPYGACKAAYGEIQCWDPQYRPRRHYRVWAPAPACLSEYGTTVCGYGCVAQYGQVRCSQTPGGVCAAAYGSITCT